MSLILTHISKFGIIHVSDSNLTAAGAAAGKGKKTFPVTYLNAGLTVAGAFLVGGCRMDDWLPNFITKQSGVGSLAEFAARLKDALDAEMSSSEKLNSGSIIHIAGYVGDSGSQHPEFYFVRNFYRMTESGDYADVRERFQVSEDFWTRDYPKNIETFEAGDCQMLYINGCPDGRIAYVGLMAKLREFFSQVWGTQEWGFRPPQSLAETALFVKLYMTIIGKLFQVSNYPAPIIGGKTQILKIAPPAK
jgi:hypothetical protein